MPSKKIDMPSGWTASKEVASLHNRPAPPRSKFDSQTGIAPESGQALSLELSSVWPMESPEDADAALAGKSDAFVYRRDGHPSDRQLSEKLCQLHNAQTAVLTAQGMSAIAAVCLSELSPGATVWIANELYGRTQRLMLHDMEKWGVQVKQFAPAEPSELERLSEANCSLVIVETISNPRLQVTDIAAVASAAKSAGAKLLVDNTFATHVICQPIALGADYAIESLGKIVNGHADSMLGLVACASEADALPLQATVSTFGMASSPLDCYLTHRGLMSLALRVQRSCENAQLLAEALQSHERIKQIDFPGLASHPQHGLTSTQLGGRSGWMVTVHLEAGDKCVERLFESLAPEICFVPSLGDVVTTVSHPASTSHRGLSSTQAQHLGITSQTIRISCGLEPTQWLVEKFLEALARA